MDQSVICQSRIKLMEEFKSFEEFDACLKDYEQKNKQLYYKTQNTRRLKKQDITLGANTKRVYKYLEYECQHGVKRHASISEGIRNPR